MPDFEDGITALLSSLVGGLILSYVVSSLLDPTSAFLANLLSILVGIVQLERAKFWGLTYAGGYFVGLALFGGYFMESWEYPIYMLIIGGYIAQKTIRKVKNQFD